MRGWFYNCLLNFNFLGLPKCMASEMKRYRHDRGIYKHQFPNSSLCPNYSWWPEEWHNFLWHDSWLQSQIKWCRYSSCWLFISFSGAGRDIHIECIDVFFPFVAFDHYRMRKSFVFTEKTPKSFSSRAVLFSNMPIGRLLSKVLPINLL